MRGILCGLLIFSASVWGAHPICVRHYAPKDGVDVCERFSLTYAYLEPLRKDLEVPVCARIYADLFCEQATTYEYVNSLNRGRVCVLNDNQPPVSQLCETVPQFYEYIKEGSED